MNLYHLEIEIFRVLFSSELKHIVKFENLDYYFF